MIMGVQITGIRTSLDGMQREVQKHKRAFRAGLIAAGLTLEAACTEKITTVLYSIPEDDDKQRKRTGNLRASRFTIWTGRSNPGSSPRFEVIEGEEPVTPGYTETLQEAEKIIQDNSAGEQTAVVVGYGAYYAIFVHEGVQGKFEGFKWVELALNEVKDKMVSLITANGGAGI